MTTIHRIKEGETEQLSALASRIVKEHYDPILGAKQNDYMIEKFQSVAALEEQLLHGYEYYFVTEDGQNVGFIAIAEKEGMLYLSKFYLDRAWRGKKIGSAMMSFVKEEAKKRRLSAVFLNVNKHNDSTIAIYKSLGFTLLREEKNPIGEGYYMDDYVLICKT